MEIFRFIKWQWNRFAFEDLAVAFMLAAVACSVIVTWITSGIIAAIFVGIIAIVIAGLLLTCLDLVMIQWYKYKRDKDLEAQQVVDILAGKTRR